jgi:hypothetical protein
MTRLIARIVVVALVAVAAAVTPSAAGSPTRSLPIRLGVGIGPINLGMSGQQVRRAFGRPRAVIIRRVVDGQPYVEFEWSYGAWKVGLLGRKGKRRVVLVGTTLERHRTPEGIGVGTRSGRLSRAYRGQFHRRECWRVVGARSGDTHLYLRHQNAETHFDLTHVRDCPYTGCPSIQYEYVGEIEVRAPPTLNCAF